MTTILAMLASGLAQAASIQIQEVPEPQPELAARLAHQAAAVPYLVPKGPSEPSNPNDLAAAISGPGVTAGLIIIDQIVNLGQVLWKVIVQGRPVANINQNVASAVPKGITSWEQLQGWGNPVTKLYHTSVMSGMGYLMSEFYFRLLFTPGGNYNGAGKFLTGVTIMPADLTVHYSQTLGMTTNVVEIVNHGTSADPVAGMTLQLKWTIDTLFSHNEQAISFHVRGDGSVNVLAGPGDRAIDVEAPSKYPPGPTPWPPDPGIDDGIGAG